MTTKRVSGKPVSRLSRADLVRDAYRLDALDGELCKILNENPTATYPELCALTGATRKQVEYRLTKPAVRKRLYEMRKTKEELIQDAKLMGIRRLMQLVLSKDEWTALQACKILLAGELSQAPIAIQSTGNLVIYETQVGAQGQIIQTMRQAKEADPTLNPQQLPTTLDLVMRAGIAVPPEVESA